MERPSRCRRRGPGQRCRVDSSSSFGTPLVITHEPIIIPLDKSKLPLPFGLPSRMIRSTVYCWP